MAIPKTTRRALFAAAPAILVAAALPAVATTGPEPMDREALAWIDKFIREGGSLQLVPGTDVIFAGATFYVGEAPEMLAAMTAGNPLRPRIVRTARAMILAGAL